MLDRTLARIDVSGASDAALMDAMLQANRVDVAAIALCSKLDSHEDVQHFDIAIG